MASRGATVLVLAMAMAGMLVSASAQTSGQSCSNYVMLANCFQAAQSSSGAPGSTCCASISKFANYKNRADCLCQTVLAARNSGIQFNIGNALSIPSRCGFHQQIPAGYKCGGYTVPS